MSNKRPTQRKLGFGIKPTTINLQRWVQQTSSWVPNLRAGVEEKDPDKKKHEMTK